MRSRSGLLAVLAVCTAAGLSACGQGAAPAASVSQSLPPTSAPAQQAAAVAGGSSAPTASATPTPSASPSGSPQPSASAPGKAKTKPAPPAVFGNPKGAAAIPADARAVPTSHPDRVIGKGTPASCTSAAVVAAVAKGGVITFDCGPKPVTITMAATAKVVNTVRRVVLDGGGRVTLSGAGKRRILYQNTCDAAQKFATSHCQDQETPQLVVQNITLANGNSSGQLQEGGGGGAVFDRGGRLKIVNSRFVGNRCDSTGADLGGGAVRALSQSKGLPVYVVNSTFEKGTCSNGGALSSIMVSWTVLNSVFRDNKAIGYGANPAKAGTPGGGSGGAIYNDGLRMTLRIAGSILERNSAKEGGGAVFYVSNDRSGTMRIENSTLRSNPNAGFQTAGFPGIFYLGATPTPTVVGPRPR